MSKQPSTPMKTFKNIISSDHLTLEGAFNNRTRVRKIEKQIFLMGKECRSKTFKKWILENTECIPTKYLEYLWVKTGNDPAKIYESPKLANAIFQHYGTQLEKMRTLYLRTESSDYTENFEFRVQEQTESELQKYTKYELRNQFNLEQLQKAMFPFLFRHAKIFSWDQLLEKHREIYNGPKSIKKRDIEQNISRTDNVKEIVYEKSPWKTTQKIKSYANRKGWSYNQFLHEQARHNADVFVMKDQKRLMKHYYGPRYTFVIDYMFAGKFVYLIAINMNTRKAFAFPAQKIKQTEQYWKVPNNVKESAEESVATMRKLMQLTPVKHLVSDQEHIWKNSKIWKDFLKQEGITHDFYVMNDVKNIIETQEKNRANHSTTSLVDRLIRTLRTMAYTLGERNEIQPKLMEYLIEEYNNSPHSTLTKYLKKPTCPNEVDENVDLETKLVKAIMIQNMFVEADPEYQLGNVVKVYNQAHNMDKVKPKLLPGNWRVMGFNKGLVQVKQGETELNVNRWMLKNAV